MIKVEKISWPMVVESIRKLNFGLFEAMSSNQRDLNENYVYRLEIPFGIDIMHDGKPYYFNSEFLESVNFQKAGIDKESFLNDFKNKNDHPLGIVEKGIIEIYGENKYVLFENEDFEYHYPLEIIRTGELIGTFGAIDLIFDTYEFSKYNYSASSGNHSGFIALPKKLQTGRKNYEDKIKDIYKDFNILKNNEKFDRGEFFSSFFPKLITGIGTTINEKTIIILIPDFWIYGGLSTFDDLTKLLFNTAWKQSQKSRIYDSDVSSVYESINSTYYDPRQYLYAEMIVYLKGILNGKRLLLKPVSNNSLLYSIYCILKERIGNLYDPIIFEFSYLSPGESGLFPLFNFPTSSVIGKINNAKEFIQGLQNVISRDFDYLKDGLRFYTEPTIWYKENFSTNVFTQLFLTRSVLTVSL